MSDTENKEDYFNPEEEVKIEGENVLSQFQKLIPVNQTKI